MDLMELHSRLGKGNARRRRSEGFTLAEVLVAVLVLSVALLVIIGAMAAARETQKRAGYIAAGRCIAQSKIEQMRSASCDKFPTMTGTSTDSSLPSGNTVQVSAAEYPEVDQQQLYLVQVTVSWPEGASVRNIHYETLVAQR
jgi:prepilin-type N-terminal cleavage/methylation domain-containing protein